jgi:la-related protein 1
MRLYFKSGGNLDKTREVVKRAVESISTELIWKVYYQAAQLEEQTGNYDRARALFAQTVKHCPKSLCWKTWLSGSACLASFCRVLHYLVLQFSS